MKYFYDTEFLESGPDYPVELISIGLVREDGQAFYAVHADAPWHRIAENEWLMANVVPSLPLEIVYDAVQGEHTAVWQENTPIYDRGTIAAAVRDFLVPPADVYKWAGKTEIWGWYSDYDHVVLAQLFGRMIDLPEGIPMYTRDLKQEVDIYLERYPQYKGAVTTALAKADEQAPTVEHNALEDAMQLSRRAHAFWALQNRAKRRG